MLLLDGRGPPNQSHMMERTLYGRGNLSRMPLTLMLNLKPLVSMLARLVSLGAARIRWLVVTHLPRLPLLHPQRQAQALRLLTALCQG